jgi:hypothetical protein
MAHAPPIPADALAYLAQQLADRPSPRATQILAARQSVGIAESFPVFALGLDATSDPSRPLQDIATPTGMWHHQLRHGPLAHEFARSVVNGPSATDWKISEVVSSDSSEKIDDAIGWIDANVPGDPVARLLVAPAYYLTAFWLEDPNGSQIVVADRPEQYSMLEFHHLYTAQEFLQLLSEAPHARGVPEQR